jgi:hypothetical protein
VASSYSFLKRAINSAAATILPTLPTPWLLPQTSFQALSKVCELLVALGSVTVDDKVRQLQDVVLPLPGGAGEEADRPAVRWNVERR